MYKRLVPDLIIEGRQLFPVRFSVEKYHWSSIFSCGISPASTLWFWISFPGPATFLTQKRDFIWQIITSQSTGHTHLLLPHFFLTYLFRFGVLVVKATYLHVILDCVAQLGLAGGSSHACRLLPPQTKASGSWLANYFQKPKNVFKKQAFLSLPLFKYKENLYSKNEIKMVYHVFSPALSGRY